MTTKEEVKKLWKLCFNDSPEFTELYFEQRYKDEINRSICRDGQVVSALQAIPYPMTFCGGVIPVSYISGACTHPDYRSQGIMKELLTETHRWMYNQGILLGMLIPAERWLFDYYAQSGYAPIFGYVNHMISINELRPSAFYSIADETNEREFLFEHYHYLTTALRKRPCCVQHYRDDFLVIMEDLRLSRGILLVARKANQIAGMAFCLVEDGRLVIKELLADNEMVHDSLLCRAARIYDKTELSCLTPAFSSSHYLGMARVIHAEKLLTMFAEKHPELELYVELEGDEAIPENNGYYNLKQGNCTRGQLSDKSYRLCSLLDFTRLLLEAEHPYMSLMLN